MIFEDMDTLPRAPVSAMEAKKKDMAFYYTKNHRGGTAWRGVKNFGAFS